MNRPHPFVLASLAFASTMLAQQPVRHATRQPVTDPTYSTLPGGVMLSVPGVFTDFVLAGGGQFVQFPDGTARLTGRVFSDSSIYSAFLLDITFSGEQDPGDPSYPPAGAPDLGLEPAAYAPIGPVDANSFVYYTAAAGTLTGVRYLDGAVLQVTATAPVQVGLGANNRNALDGLEALFAVSNLPTAPLQLAPTGSATLTVDLIAPWGEHTTHPQPDATRTGLVAGRAMTLPGVGDDYVFVPAATFTEFADGHTVLTGKLARLSQLDDAFDVALTMTDRLEPGEANYPPAGSPVLQMYPSAYVANGGTMDPASWHYYTTVSGTLTGTGQNAGGVIDLVPAVAVQVGGGANQTNTYMGFYGAFAPTIVTQPTGRTLAITGDVELFGLTAIFPVLPFPTLTVPAVVPSLPTLTDQGVVLEGDNLAWTELVSMNWDLIGGGDATHWAGGYFRVIDNQHVEFHPRPGQLPGSYSVFVFNPAVLSNTIQLDLTAPTTPALFAEPTVASFFTTHVRIHHGPAVGPCLSLVLLSPTLAPSVFPGLVSLDIGNGFADVVLDPIVYAHDAQTGIAEANYGPIDPALQGAWFYFQAAILDAGAQTMPLPVSNPWRVDFD